MKTAILSLAATALISMSVSASPMLLNYTTTSFNYPGAKNTQVGGISDSGEIVGTYSAGVQQVGFTDIGGSFTSIAEAGGPTVFNAVSSNGLVVGNYPAGGFIYDAGDFTDLSYPDSTYTSAISVNASGVVVGEFAVNGELGGYLYENGTYSPLDTSGAPAIPSAINDAGTIVGSIFYAPYEEQAFEDVNGTLTAFTYPADETPGNYCATEFLGINNDGEILGSYAECGRFNDESGYFLYNDGSISNLSIAFGSTPDWIGNLNDAGEFGGFYVNGYQGFIASDPASDVPEPGTMLLLGTGLAGLPLLRKLRVARSA